MLMLMCISVRCLFQMSCLGVEACVDGDPTRFALTSRGADGNTVRFILQSSSVDISRSWVSDVNQILETQRNFLNGELSSTLSIFRSNSAENLLRIRLKRGIYLMKPFIKFCSGFNRKIITHTHTGPGLKVLLSVFNNNSKDLMEHCHCVHTHTIRYLILALLTKSYGFTLSLFKIIY